MAAPSPPTGNGYPFATYPGDYLFSHHGFETPPPGHGRNSYPPPQQVPPVDLPMMPQNPNGYPPHMAAMMQPGGAPVGQIPPSPIMHNSMPTGHASPQDAKMLRHMMQMLAKMQNMMKDVAERQEQILDRMSVLEQRVGRMDDLVGRIDEQVGRVEEGVGRVDDGVGRLDEQMARLDESVARVDEQLGKTDELVDKVDAQLKQTDECVFKVLEQVELTAEDSKSIRARVDDNESQDAFEKRLTGLMDGVVEKLVSGLGNEIKDVKKLVKDTEKYVKYDPFSYNGRHQYMGQRYRDAMILSEEEQKEVHL